MLQICIGSKQVELRRKQFGQGLRKPTKISLVVCISDSNSYADFRSVFGRMSANKALAK